MLTARFDPQSFFQRTENVALHVPASEIFSLLKRSIDLPPQWGALVVRTTGDQAAIGAGGIVEAENAEDVLFVRLAPTEIKLRLEGTGSRDGFAFDADVRMRLHPVSDRSELAGFLRTVMGSRRVIQVESLATHFQPAVHGALTTLISGRDAAQLRDATNWHSAAEAVGSALQVPLFTAGLVLEGTPCVTFESTMFRSVQKAREGATVRQAEHEASRQVSESLHAARAQHLDHLADSLARLKELAAASPGVELPELIRTFSEHQRGQLYEALFATDTPIAQTQWIVVVCSDELLFFDAGNPAQAARRLRIDGTAGPARSVRFDVSGVLLVGAARGVYAWPLDGVVPERTFVVKGESAVRGGFNSVVKIGDVVAATHSELGICEWNGSDGEPRAARFADWTRGAKTVRNMAQCDGELFCSIDDRVVQWRSESSVLQPDAVYTGAASTISALEPSLDGLYAGTSEGDLVFWPAGKTEHPEVLHRGMDRAIESVGIQRFHGVRRLVFANTSPRVQACVVGDNFTFHYEAGGQTLRRVEVAPDLLVATNELRDRLICWSPAKPNQPTHIIHVGKLSGRNVQDVCLVPAEFPI